MELKIKDLKTGQIYSNDMSDNNKHTIIEMHFCTSYTQVIVQDDLIDSFPTHDVILPPLGSLPNWIDEIAIQGDNRGEWIKQ